MGIRIYNRPDRPKSPFGIKWSENGSRRFRFFSTERERDAFIRDFTGRIKKVGSHLLELSSADAAIMADCVKRLGSSAEVLRAVEEYSKRTNLPAVSFKSALQEFLDEKLNAGFDEDYLRHVEMSLARLQSSIGEFVKDVSFEEARDWISSLSFSPRTVKGYVKISRTFWRWLVSRGYARENVFEKIPIPKIEESEPEFLSVEDVQALMGAAQSQFPDSAAYFALGAFAGLRSSAVVRLGTDHIRFDQKGILITGENAKNSRRQFVDGHEPNLWAWMDWCQKNAPEGFSLGARLWERRRGQVAEAAKVEMPHNALRHSFCTYHCALYGDAGKTATLLTHRGNVAILYQHYKGNATRGDAERFFGILPKE